MSSQDVPIDKAERFLEHVIHYNKKLLREFNVNLKKRFTHFSQILR